MTFRVARVFRLAAAAALLALLAGCKASDLPVTSIKALLDDPGRFDKQTVRIAGDVTRSLGVLGYGAYDRFLRGNARRTFFRDLQRLGKAEQT